MYDPSRPRMDFKTRQSISESQKIRMQNFETFVKVCGFFVQSKLDPTYVKTIDKQLERPANKEVVILVKHVKAFHSMRKTLCSTIMKRLNCNRVLNILLNGSGCVQYKSVPEKSTCAISNAPLKTNTGILLVVDSTKLITVHSRYKIILYHFWNIVHMPEQIGLEAVNWLNKQYWWQNGSFNDIKQCGARVLNYNDQIFVKSLYVKLKTIAEYVDTDFKTLPLTVK